MSPRKTPGDRDVFLNVPFDKKYEPIFLALIGGLVALGRKPRCVLEIPDSGTGRLTRILKLIASCRTSIHDLSRVTGSGNARLPRFNMPFELGLACCLSALERHDFFLFEARSYRLQKTLSDVNGIDPQIHEGKQEGAITCLFNCFGTTGAMPSLQEVLRLVHRLSRVARELKRKQGAITIFQPHLFRQLVEAATELAQEEEWIP